MTLDWASTTIANCYYRAGLPRLTRPFRERYTVSTASGARWPNIRKRSAPMARILYYHRVNDDNDPFFPATPTALFDAEMRFLASHYRVVSMDQLADHLDGDLPETVVAITFDDGYRDNFENAFPILQRYAIPATIFLTTGCIDTAEPLWFERLSLAFKKTGRQRLHLATDPAMHCPLTTLADRVDSNNRVQAFLRELPDRERLKWVQEITRQLGITRDTERQGKMLTWDQVRYMSARGIDFGGHTVTHPFLSRTTEEDAAHEIAGCKSRIEQELQAPTRYFAYPNGHEPDVSASNRDLVRRAGYRAAVTTTWGPNDPQTDRMGLKRGGPWETSAAMFAYKFDWYQLTNG